jgi:methylaspartate mutase sigma subunit
MTETAPTIVLGVIGADCHSVGNRILELHFTQQGFRVVNLGVMVSQDEFIDAAIETGAVAILVSSLYGHGEIDCAGFRERCIERGLDKIVLYVGGNLVVGKTAPEVVLSKFTAMGFDRVFLPGCDLDEAAALLHKDVRAAKGRRVLAKQG